MCGFVGIYDNHSLRDEFYVKNKLKDMAESIKFRGPDDYGCWIDVNEGVGISHRRLSIQDLSKSGHQPMKSQNERYIIAFNGEIYNHLELRKELEKKNKSRINWMGKSDTETLLKLFENFEFSETLTKIKGMFSIALWDRKNKHLFLARDRFGEKPLYYGFVNFYNFIDEELFVFSSDLNPLKNISRKSLSLNKQALTKYFKFGYIPAPISIFEGISQLKPGTYIKLDCSNKENTNNKLITNQIEWYSPEKRSFHLSTQNKFESMRYPEIINNLEKKLLSTVKQQTISDVPVGSFLSGGIDSSLITSLLQAQNNIPIRTFTIGFPDFDNKQFGNYNEAPFAKKVADYLGTKHNEIAFSSKDIENLIPNLTKIYSEPFSDSSQIPTTLISKFAKDSGISVALTGDGSDELFGGYNRHFLAPKIYKYFKEFPYLLKKISTYGLNLLPLSKTTNKQIAKQKLFKAIVNSSEISSIYDSLLSNSLLNYEEIFDSSMKLDIETKELPLANSINERVMLADTIEYLNADILTKVDRASMWSSLETRAPFLDHEIAELAWALPLDTKIRNKGLNWESKWILRQILFKYVPRELIERPKSGFAVPIGEFLRGSLRKWADELLNCESNMSSTYLNNEFIKKIWASHLHREKDHSQILWSILIWKSWLIEWNY